jgi:long-chain acyl-CoA synthetase
MVQDVRPQSVFLVPAHAHMLRMLGDDAIAGFDTSSLQTVYFNAAPLPQALKLWFMDAFAHAECHELYGSTEAGIVSNLRPGDMRRKEACVGPPWFMTEVRLVDPDGNIVEGPGEGELFSRSPYLMNGYLDDPDATAACTTDDGFLTSGDIARRDEDGFLYIIDRVKDLIITGGSNVYPREVEEVLATHPAVAEVAVIGTADEQWGEAVTACVVLRDGHDLDEAALDAHCRTTLAGYKVPKRYEVVPVLPRNAAMKILKRELRDQLATTSDGARTS